MGKEKMCGIYCIENMINNKKYIGQSINLQLRKLQHKRKSVIERNTFLYKAIQKYGINNFKFYILELCEENELDDKEMYWIDFLNTYTNGYNMTTGGCVVKAYIYNRDKLPSKFKEFSGFDIIDTVNIVELDENFNIINEWKSVQSCSRETGIHATNITKCAKLKHLTANKRIFMYKKDIEDLEKNEILEFRNKLRSDLKYDKNFSTSNKKINLIDDKGKLIKGYDSINSAANELNIDCSSIVKVCKGRLKQTGGYKFEYNII